MLSRLKLSTRFTLLLSVVFIGGILLSGVVLWQALLQRAQTEVTTNGLILIDAMSSVRHYTSSRVRPLLAEDLEVEPEFIAETVPAFSARTVFENFRENEAYADFFYKEATLNPMNEVNQADGFESQLVVSLRNEPEETELHGYRTLAGEEVFYIARPLAIGAESCLGCHGDPAVAPVSLTNSYGTDGGFGWELGQIVGAQMIYVPAGQVFDAALRSFLLVIGIFIGTFALVLVLINVLLRQYVIQPIEILNTLASKISDDELQRADLQAAGLAQVTQRGDELGKLAAVFQHMAEEVHERTEQLKQRVQRLTIEIDEMKRQEQVEEVVSTDFFRDLQAKAKRMRAQHEAKAQRAGDELTGD
ncbi:MAG: DUF3365 domain-containing protein [Candidatus Promineifilaceae bacterium]|nr:DUF3365 domain-containing protein [Candidatus Promineifilaceae bacterium]